jgi:flagellin
VDEIDREATVAGLDTATGFSVFISAADGSIGESIGAVDTTTLGLTTLTMTDVIDAEAALDEVVAAIDTLGDVQSTIGTLSNRLQFAVNLATSQSINKRAAESRIRDANIAEESANMTKFNILSQSGIAALAQANQSTASVLALLR